MRNINKTPAGHEYVELDVTYLHPVYVAPARSWLVYWSVLELNVSFDLADDLLEVSVYASRPLVEVDEA